MASTYTELRREFLDLSGREDMEQAFDTLLSLAEAEFNRNIRHSSMLARKTATVTSSRIALPSDWLEAFNIQISDQKPDRLQYVSPYDLDYIRDVIGGNTGKIQYYSIVGSELEVVPAPAGSSTIEMIYYAKIPALTSSAPSNWLLLSSPDVYLFGALGKMGFYLGERDSRFTAWATQSVKLIDDVNKSDMRNRVSGGPLNSRGKLWR